MRVLKVHNHYQQPGGEDISFRGETALLRRFGVDVTEYVDTNSRIRNGLGSGLTATWNHRSYRTLRRLVSTQKQYQVAHFHNTFPLISPAAYYAVSAGETAVIQTLHNYRLICPGGLLLRDGVPCTDCVDQNTFLPALRHRCYRGSLLGTAAASFMLTAHEFLGTWSNRVDLFIAPTEFSKRTFVQAGLPADKIVVKPHLLDREPEPGQGGGTYAAYVGRLSAEKGIQTLREAWRTLGDIPLRIAGSGPLAGSQWPPGVIDRGYLNTAGVDALLRDATTLVVPSLWYEIGPLTVLEAFACGTPVIASNLGSMAERVRDGHNGLLFRPGDAQDLAAKVRYAFTHPEHMAQMRVNARREYEEKYTPERNYRLLMAIYEQAMENAKRRKRKAS